MSGNLPIVLIVVMWIFVLAPLLLRGQKPIRRTNKALEETRVVYEGGSGAIDVPRRRPRFTKSDVHRDEVETDEDFELVDSYELDDAAEGDDATPVETEEDVLDGEVLAHEEDGVAVRVDASMLADADTEPVEGTYEVNSSYLEPADLMYPDEPETDELEDPQLVADEHSDAEPAELSAEEIAFAERRKGRGGFDPQADAEVSLDRFERRKRTLLALVVALVAAIPVAFLVGTWMWALPVLVVLTIVMYLWALRQQVKEENRVRARRIRNLRRARLGVKLGEEEEKSIPARLRTPAGIVLEVDDASPDFDGSLPEVQFVSSELQQAG
ncbi:MAG: hypothetical protein SPK00_08535 [Corynebacterium glucuronolyticum]|nr:hypothetical protein [Corynebacterium glucuronolyticum]MDD7587087.1 hypothetical protein [Mycobacteriaceae bacterium]MDY5834774.1 hypothetical protein [Corynebacterium glucuronolyticum]